MSHHSSTRFVRRGFTLLELLLVLAILAMMGAIAAPMLGNMLERQKLRGAVETMRLKWEEARLQAMKTGQTQVFTCELATGNYSIKPLVLQSDAVNVGSGATLATTGGLVQTENYGRGTVVTAASSPDEFNHTLEDTVTFLSCRVASDMRSYLTAQESQSMGTGDLNTQSMSQSVIFYADGSTSTAEVQLQNSVGDARALQLRGLTGQSRVVEIANAASSDS